ncbi:MAG: hypothetical protein JSY10_05825 [Paenibacillus sp.]|nr:hypothetical protein [Paenibacillus sp.]
MHPVLDNKKASISNSATTDANDLTNLELNKEAVKNNISFMDSSSTMEDTEMEDPIDVNEKINKKM